MLSIVIPLYNEEPLIEQLSHRLSTALDFYPGEKEVIFVNDGSTDRTLELLLQARQSNPTFKVINFSRNFGHQAAILAGLRYAKGDYIGVMDGDLQDPPETFNLFYEKLKSGYEVAYGVRKKRKEGWIKKTAYHIYYRLLIGISNMRIPVDSGDFGLMTRRVLNEVLNIKEQSLFLRGLRHWVGFQQIGVPYERDERQAGDTKYNLKRLFKLAYNGIFGFSAFPIKLLGRLGYFTVLLSVIYAVFLVSKRMIWGDVPEGYTTLILAIFFFGGVQLISIRILGEYVSRIYDETRERPSYIVENTYL